MYEIQFTDGEKKEIFGTYDEAIAYCDDHDYVYGHDGDLTGHGDRTLIWVSESEAENDDGTHAIAEIRSMQESPRFGRA